MSWYSNDYKRRMPIVVDGSAYTSANAQVIFNVPDDWDDFWNNIRSDGNDIVVTDRTGDFKVGFEKTFNYSDRTLSIKVNIITTSEESSMHLMYLYWDFPDETTDHETPVTIVSALTGYIYLGSPFGFIVNLNNRSSLSTVPSTIVQKDPDEKIDIWFPYSQLMATRSLPFNERLDFKGIQSFTIEVLDSAGANQTSLFALEESRVINGWIRTRIQSGTVDTDYVVRLIIKSTDSEIFVLSTLLKVKKLLPT